MLPPKPTPKRDIAVNIRFNRLEYERLKLVADYRGISVATLLHYVVTNAVLPRLEREMQKEQDQAETAPEQMGTTSVLLPTSDEEFSN